MPIAAAIGAGAMIGSSILGGLSQRSANKTNMRINQMNNEFNAKEAEKQRQWQESMWNKENEYNTASAQRQRLEDAGLNPYMMLNGGSAGIAGGAGSGSAASAASPLGVSPYRIDPGSVGSAVASISQAFTANKVGTAQASSLGSQADYYKALSQKTAADTDWGRLTPDARKWLRATGIERLKLGYSQEQQELDNMRHTGQLIKAQSSLQRLNAKAQQVINKYLEPTQQADLALKASLHFSQLTHGHLNEQSVRESIAREVETYARANGQKISNRVAYETADGLIDSLKQEYHDSAEYHRSAASYAKGRASVDYLKGYYDYKMGKREFRMMPWREGFNSLEKVGNTIGNVLPFKFPKMYKSAE